MYSKTETEVEVRYVIHDTGALIPALILMPPEHSFQGQPSSKILEMALPSSLQPLPDCLYAHFLRHAVVSA